MSEVCRRQLAIDLVEGMRDPDTHQPEPDFCAPEKDCRAVGCVAVVSIMDSVVITAGGCNQRMAY